MNTKPVYIHYGDNQFRKPEPVRNKPYGWVKPLGGMWASRKDDPLGWRNWCKREDFYPERLNSSFEFTLRDGAKVLALSKSEQLNCLPKVYNFFGDAFLDFDTLKQDYDAIELTDISNLYFHQMIYGWDCNCILIMNPDIVEVIEKEADIHGGEH